MLTILNELPQGFLTIAPQDLIKIIPNPTLIHLGGRQNPPLFVSILLHGNEVTGLRALQEVLRNYQYKSLPRALSLFVGNVSAASQNLRRLDHQPDYNRIWSTTRPVNSSTESLMAWQVWSEMQAKDVFASIDIHNNTGLNPHYACINRLESRFFQLATLFARTVVYFTQPTGTQTAAFADLCPSVTLECGKPDSPGSAEHAARIVDACLHLSHFPDQPVLKRDIDLYHTLAIVKVPEDVEFSFGEELCDINFVAELDHLNFCELPVGTLFGRVNQRNDIPLIITTEHGNDIPQDLFILQNHEIRTNRYIMPAMLTLDKRAIRQDCLCYIMERLPFQNVQQNSA